MNADTFGTGILGSGMGLCCEARGDDEGALTWFTESRTRCGRETDIYVALLVAIIADQARVSARLGHAAQASACAREGLSLAARAHMDAHVHRAVQMLGPD